MRDISSTGPRLHRDALSPAPPLPRPAHRFAPPALPGRWGSCERVPFSSSSIAPCLLEQTHRGSLWSGKTSAPVRGRGGEGRGGEGRGRERGGRRGRGGEGRGGRRGRGDGNNTRGVQCWKTTVTFAGYSTLYSTTPIIRVTLTRTHNTCQLQVKAAHSH